ncbi:SIS domain-containing protein [Gracilibacillus timonensis]|uniref:SIS domain-containing protein n=1 Tax=Gracilibacillus timonensis TaxID=1816696 RepID=UPI000826C6B3|nr:SIS domain-containing protein [Gracilibacillus timonensis]
MFHITNEELQSKQALHTVSEIIQQPEVWEKLRHTLLEQQGIWEPFLSSIYEKHEYVRIIFTGAGTSAFIGDTITPFLRSRNQKHVQFDSIATTDIVASPNEYLQEDVPTILVSFARSGNSPESVAATKLGERLVTDFYQVIITCNKEGQLATGTKEDNNAITILMPDRAHDKGFAMTSSFTCMLISAYTLFTSDDLDHSVIEAARELISNLSTPLTGICDFEFERIIYLGSGMLGPLSREASLKMLELSAGTVVALYESSLGFRHGPKFVLNDKSVVVLFLSQDCYTRKYDMDILREIADSPAQPKIIAVTTDQDSTVETLSDWVISVSSSYNIPTDDFHAAILYIIFAQGLALQKSLKLGITPDNPSPDGSVNRVVQGVTIYEYHK